MTRQRSLLITTALLVPILIYAYVGRFSRLMADDFCYAVSARTLGLPAAIASYYDNWFGRLTQTVGALVGTSIGVTFAQVFPALLLALWLVGLMWLCRELGLLLKMQQRETIPLIAALILFGTLAGTPQIFHSLYWISGVFPFTVPLVLASYFAALVLRALRLERTSALAVLAAVVLSFVATLSSEPFGLMFVGAIAGGIAGILLIRRRPQARRAVLVVLSVAEITALVALGIMVAAPGNTLRQGLFTPTHAVAPLVIQSLVYALATPLALAALSPPALLLALALPAMIAYNQPITTFSKRTLRLTLLLVLVVAVGLVVLVTVPAIYATSLPPPARTLIIAQFIFICAYVIFGWLLGLLVRKSIRRVPRPIGPVVIGLLLIAGPLLTTAQMIALAPKLYDYAQEWDIREGQIIAAAASGQTALVVVPLTIDIASMTGLDRIGTDSQAPTNTCAAQYYGIQSLSASS